MQRLTNKHKYLTIYNTMKNIIHSSLLQPTQGGLAYWSVDCAMNTSIREPQEGLS
jgi:hypothetical protein